MSSSRDKILFWCLIAVEAAGSKTIMWNGIPIYRRLLSPGTEGAGLKEFVFTIIVILIMQAAHWMAFRLQPRLHFRRNVFLGHVLVFIGELSMFFISSLAVVILFDRFGEIDFVLWKIVILVALLFAIFAYKHQLSKLGENMIEGLPDAEKK